MGDLTNNEAATLLISLLSFVASAIGIIVAVIANSKANDISRQANEIAILQAKETSHGRLAETLSSIDHRLEKPLKELSKTANLALISITNLIGEYEHRESNKKAPRHIYYHCCEEASSVLSKQIVGQTSVYLHRRLDSIRQAEDPTKEGQSIQHKLDFAMYNGPVHRRRGIFRLLSPRVPVDSAELETELKGIYANISKTNSMRLFIRGRELCERYIELLEETKPLIASALEELGAAGRLNKYQHFKLEHADELHLEYKRIVDKLEFLQECDLDKVRSTSEQHVYNPISQLLYIGIILKIVSENYYGI